MWRPFRKSSRSSSVDKWLESRLRSYLSSALELGRALEEIEERRRRRGVKKWKRPGDTQEWEEAIRITRRLEKLLLEGIGDGSDVLSNGVAAESLPPSFSALSNTGGGGRRRRSLDELAEELRALPHVEDQGEEEDLEEEDISKNKAKRRLPPQPVRLPSLEAETGGGDASAVVGEEKAERALEERLVLPARFPALMGGGGKRKGARVLLVGAPGTGKTSLARAVAGKMGKGRTALYLSGSELHTWPSVSQARSILLSAFSSSNSSSSLVILDDLDILSNSSVLSEDDERGARTRRALMQAMEGEEREEPLSVLAVTASPWSVGKRLLSSFDVMVGTAGCLGKAEREAVLRRELKEEDEKDGDSSLSVWVADETEGFTGADLVALVAEARLRAAVRAEEDGDVKSSSSATSVIAPDLARALLSVRPSTNAEDRRRVEEFVIGGTTKPKFQRKLPPGVLKKMDQL